MTPAKLEFAMIRHPLVALLTASPLVAALLFSATTAHATTDPVARTRALVEAFKAVKQPAEGKTLSAADRTANAAAFKALDDFFDRQTLTTQPLAAHAAKMTPAQTKAFGEMFYPLIRLVAFPNSSAFFHQAKWSVKAGKARTDAALHAEIVADDVQTDLTFHWRADGGTLRIVDVSFDGSSMMKDYSNQFGRILAKKGADDLLAKLKKRYEAEERARKGLLP